MKPKIKLNKIYVRIVETIQGWDVYWPQRCPEGYATAAEAYAAVRTVINGLAKVGISTITQVEWESKTKIGKMVVKAITQK